MTILSYGINAGGIIGLWVLLTMFSGIGFVFSVAFAMIEYVDWKTILTIILCAVLLVVGILGLVFWTPHYNYVKVYSDKNFKIDNVTEQYNLIETDGYIVTLQEKEPINK